MIINGLYHILDFLPAYNPHLFLGIKKMIISMLYAEPANPQYLYIKCETYYYIYILLGGLRVAGFRLKTALTDCNTIIQNPQKLPANGVRVPKSCGFQKNIHLLPCINQKRYIPLLKQTTRIMTDKKIAIVHLPGGKQIIYTNVPVVNQGDKNYQLVDTLIFSPEDLTVTYQEDGGTVTKCYVNCPVEIEMW